MSKQKVTVWVVPYMANRFKVVKTQNTIHPSIGEFLLQDTVQKLIDDGVVVNVQEGK